MSKLSHVTLRLLGAFAIEANVGRPIPISVRSRKARALLAFLAMKPDYRASREELATLFWGDNPDALARHSLRQCLISLRQDLCLASEILIVDREAIGLRTQFVSVDARRFISLARSAAPDELTRAAELWHGAFLPDLGFDIEEFDTWHRHEAERLATAAAGVFEALCRTADANGDGDRAIAAAERLVALEPTREDRQRTALMLFARHEGREAALSRAKRLTDLLRSDLGVSPQAATRALIDAIKRGDFESAHAPTREQPAARSVVKLVSLPDRVPPSLPGEKAASVPAPAVLTAAPASRNTTPANPPFWRCWPLAAACAIIAFLAMGTIVALGVASAPKLWSPQTDLQRSQALVVLPFVVDNSGQPADPAVARALAPAFGRLCALRVHAKSSSDLPPSELVARGYLALHRAAIRENLTTATTSFDAALRRDPHYQPALLAVARVHIIAAMNFIDLDFSPDLGKAELLVNEALAKSPNSIS